MTKEQKLKVNIAAANLMDGMQVIEDGAGAWCPLHNRHFNIFINPADCLAAVKKLGDIPVHIASFVDSTNGLTRWFWDDHEDGSSIHYETYEESVGAACLEIKGG